MRRLVLLLVALVGGARPSWAQTTDSLGLRPAFSMGQPASWEPYVSAFGVIPGGGPGGLGALAGIHRPITNPIVGLFGVSGEALGEWRKGENGAGLRLLARAPVFGLGLGADWRPGSGNIATILTFQTAIRRGGVFGHGSMVRLDWLPARRHTIDIGVQFPVLQPFAGRTRPRDTTTPVPAISAEAMRTALAPRGLSDSAARALHIVADAASLISTYVTLYSPADEAALAAGARLPYGHSFDATTHTYIAALASAFRTAAADSMHGDTAAARARAIVLDDVILPFDALFGQVKDDDALTGMLGLSHAHFARWLRDSSGIAPDKHAGVLAVYDRWLDILSGVAARARKEWRDSRLVWLPAQLALATDQYDEQSEVDALIGRAVGHAFTDSNSLGYLRTADLTVEIARSIIAARTYHVLYTHDFTGRRLTGELDQVAYTMVADAYLPALTAAVQRYDTSGTMPQFFVLLDAFYYHARAATIWMTILESPLHAGVHLRPSEWREAVHLRDRLDALRSAVAHSRRLQQESAAHGGASWLAKIVKVNVNVTQPSDFSFRSAHLVPPIPFTPDNVARDHRKLVLYDFTEADPYGGEFLVTGIGIGEHYASNTWEDRGYRLRGPAALEAREATRRELLANGLRPDQIPEPLRVARGVAPPSSRRHDVARVLH